MNALTRCTLTTAAAAAAIASTTGIGLASTAQAATSPFVAPTSARVAVGSTLVETSTVANTTGSTSTVYSVAASGAQRMLLRLPHREAVSAMSGDGRRIAVTAATGRTPVTKIYDLATHRVTTLSLYVARFTNPTGTHVYGLPWNAPRPTAPMVKADLAGHVTARYPGITGNVAVPSPDGLLVWGTNKGHITLNNNATGKQLRTYALPRGYAYCSASRNWDATSLVGACEPSGAGNPQVFLFHTNGTTTPLTGRLKSPTGGWIDAWRSSTGLVAQESAGCLPASPTLQVGTRLRTAPVEGVVNVRGNTLIGLTSAGCDTSIPTLVRVDLPSMAVHRLLIPSRGRTIVATVTNDPVDGRLTIG